jgi:hypothetical protein
VSNVKRYIPKKSDRDITVHDSVMAIKLTERNLESTLAWALRFGVAERGTPGALRLKTRKGWRVVKPGEYVVRGFAYEAGYPILGTDPIYTLSVGKDDFLENYEQVPPKYFW